MFGKSDTITEILSVSLAVSTQHVVAPTGSLLIRCRSGRRAEEVCILHDAALALVAAIEEQYGESRVPLESMPLASEPSARALS